MVRVEINWLNFPYLRFVFTVTYRLNSQQSRLSFPCTLSAAASHATCPHDRYGWYLRLCSARERHSDVQSTSAAPFAAIGAAQQPTVIGRGARPFSTEIAPNRLLLSRASMAGSRATPPQSKEPDIWTPGDAIAVCPLGGVAQGQPPMDMPPCWIHAAPP